MAEKGYRNDSRKGIDFLDNKTCQLVDSSSVRFSGMNRSPLTQHRHHQQHYILWRLQSVFEPFNFYFSFSDILLCCVVRVAHWSEKMSQILPGIESKMIPPSSFSYIFLQQQFCCCRSILNSSRLIRFRSFFEKGAKKKKKKKNSYSILSFTRILMSHGFRLTIYLSCVCRKYCRSFRNFALKYTRKIEDLDGPKNAIQFNAMSFERLNYLFVTKTQNVILVILLLSHAFLPKNPLSLIFFRLLKDSSAF